MQEENRSVAIRNLQRYLRAISYFDTHIPPVGIDGFFGAETEQAVRAFQELVGLEANGRVNQQTWETLFDYYKEDQAKRSAPARISHFPRLPVGYTLELGEQQFLVSVVQHALQELSIDYDLPLEVPLSGVYDEPTAAAVRYFQEKNALPATGGVDLATWNALADAYNRTFAGYFEQ